MRDKLIAVTTHFHYWAIPEGFEDMEFPVIYWRKSRQKFQGVQVHKKFMWISIAWVLVFDLWISKRCYTQFCRICRGEMLFSSEFLRVNVTNLKIPAFVEIFHKIVESLVPYATLPIHHHLPFPTTSYLASKICG